MGNCSDTNISHTVCNPTPITASHIKMFLRKFTPNSQLIFDYLEMIPPQEFIITQKGTISQSQSQITFTSISSEDKTNCKEEKENPKQTLFTLEKNKQSYTLTSQTSFTPFQQNNLWININSTPDRKFILQKDVILKFGKKLLKVLLVDTKPSKYPSQRSSISFLDLNQQNLTLTRRSSIINDLIQCRICLQSGNTKDPLVSPCQCDGSIKYIHFKCLKKWIQKNIKVLENEDHLFFFKKVIPCQMCKQPYATEYNIEGKMESLYEVLKIHPPYVILEILQETATTANSNLCIAASFSSKSQIFIGRRKSSEIRFSNQHSISRNHARISYDEIEQKIEVVDLYSRYGTLVMFKNPLQINEQSSGLQIQISNMMMEFRYKNKDSAKQVQFESKHKEYQNIENEMIHNDRNRLNSHYITDFNKTQQVFIEQDSIHQIDD